MPKAHDRSDELIELTRELQQVRRESLSAARNNDFRAMARLTCEAARLNHAIRQAETTSALALDRLGDKLFSSQEDDGDMSFAERESESALVG